MNRELKKPSTLRFSDSQTTDSRFAALRGIVQEVVRKSVAGSGGWLLIDASLGVERYVVRHRNEVFDA